MFSPFFRLSESEYREAVNDCLYCYSNENISRTIFKL